MFRDPDAAGGEHKRGAGRNIERPGAVAAGPAGIEDAIVAPRDLDGVRAHRAREADDLDRPLALHRQPDEETGDVRGRGAAFHHLGHGCGRFVGRQVLESRQLLDEFLKHRSPPVRLKPDATSQAIHKPA